MAACSITFSDGTTFELQDDLQTVIDELHRVSTRREHSFALLNDPSGVPIAVRPEAVLHIRPISQRDDDPAAD